MAQASYPFEDIDVSETQFSRWASNFQETGVKGIPGDANLLVQGDNSGLQVRVAAGEAFIRGHYYENTTQATVTLTSAGTKTRIDYIVLELSHLENTISLKDLKGAEVDLNPVAPTLTQTEALYQLPLAKVVIPNDTTSITSGMVSDERSFMSQRLGIWTTAKRPTSPLAMVTVGYNSDLGYHEFYNGSTWERFSKIPESPVTPFLLMGA